MRAFTQSQNGFTVRFRNGLGLSVRWSPFHYCEARKRMEDRKADSRRLSQAIDSHDAEVALMSPDGEVCGQPLGWVSPEFLATMFVRVRDFTLPSGRIDFTPDALELFSEELKEEWSK
tara:strand:- start:8836 stop:9189 length:354 start_codon:yes stop_codon:yes gene_type:complete